MNGDRGAGGGFKDVGGANATTFHENYRLGPAWSRTWPTPRESVGGKRPKEQNSNSSNVTYSKETFPLPSWSNCLIAALTSSVLKSEPTVMSKSCAGRFGAVSAKHQKRRWQR